MFLYPEYTDDQIRELLDTATLLANRGIKIDPKPSIFLYDTKGGFSIIDFQRRKEDGVPTGYSKEFREIAEGLIENFMPHAGSREHLSEPERIIESYKDSLKMRLRFMRVVKEHFPQIRHEWKSKQGTPQGFLWQKLKDLPDHPELNAMYAELEDLGVAWDVPPDEFERLVFKTTRQKGVEGLIADREK